MWICVVLTLVFANTCEWALGMLVTAGRLDATFDEHAQHSDQMWVATHFGNQPVALFAIMSKLGTELA